MTNIVKFGQIPAGQTTVIVAVGNMDCPMTATLVSTASGRKIELLTTGTGLDADGGWYAVTADATTTSMINAAIKAPVTHIRFTGNANDAYRVQ